ncbi:hypothetical protein QE400_000041 [Xanthomonas sacchari]|uniref:hypothetical protein n=1 Tax=Xanthomonas sacchari TaxID=56458 RepID=UPI0027816426|nr:hypothetical protein [Xanthomonas sacchari]MDQ1090628.1 hypothetical protein [Xanthomonas sacchari]
MIGRITNNSREFEATIGRYFGRGLPEGTFKEVEGGMLPEDCRELCRLFRMRPVMLHYAGTDRTLQFEAMVVNDRYDKRIFLMNHAKEPLRAVLGHELTHRMQIERPDLYGELVQAIAAADVDHGRWAAYVQVMRAKSAREGRLLSDNEIRSEAVADLVGDLLLDRRLWNALREPSLADRVVGWVQATWRRLTAQAAAPSPLGGAVLVTNRLAAISAATALLRRWANEVASNPQRKHGLREIVAQARRVGLDSEIDEGNEVIAFRNRAGNLVPPNELSESIQTAIATLNRDTGEQWQAAPAAASMAP